MSSALLLALGNYRRYIAIISQYGSVFVLNTNVVRRFAKVNLRCLQNGSLSFVSSLTFFVLFKKEDETLEDKLVDTIKRSILCIQREQHDKAEQMLHLALRMAQDLQSNDGVTYVYDVMANLAMERGQYKKAEKLFTDLLRRLFNDGLAEDNPKILHISSKIAHMAELQGDLEKSKIGFTWTLGKIEEYMKKMPDNLDVKELWAFTRNWFGQLLMKENNFKEAKKCFKDAYDCLIIIYGTANEEVITVLNNLSVVSTKMNNYKEAKYYIMEALELIRTMKGGSVHESVLKANLGLIYLNEGLIKEAQASCSNAWKTARSQDDSAGLEQAEYCLNEIKVYQSKN